MVAVALSVAAVLVGGGGGGSGRKDTLSLCSSVMLPKDHALPTMLYLMAIVFLRWNQ
jgi:hypothetical protein